MEKPVSGRLMTVREVAEYIRMSRAHVYRLVKDKSIPVVRFGEKGIRFTPESVSEFVASHTATRS